jgi:putative endonuclease
MWLPFLIMYYTYILYSQKLDSYYTGSTIDIERRLSEHNRGKTSYSRKGIPWKVIYSVSFHTRNEAVNHENQIKKRGVERFLEDQKKKKG